MDSVKIGKECFMHSNEERDNSKLQITNCQHFHRLEIGDGSFAHFKQFELSKLNSLQSIEIGQDCLGNSCHWILDELGESVRIKIGTISFLLDRRNIG